MRRSSARALGVALLVFATFAATAAGAETTLVESDHQLYLRNDGADCGAADHPFLSTEAGTADINCGYIGGGLPFGEVFHAADIDNGRTFATEGGTSLLVDGSREVTGVVTVRRGSQQGVGLPGGGQIVADIALRGISAGKFIDFGPRTLEGTAVPGEERIELPFTFDVPANADGAVLSHVEFDLNVRGVHLWHGFMELNGKTSFTLPVLIEETSPEEG